MMAVIEKAGAGVSGREAVALRRDLHRKRDAHRAAWSPPPRRYVSTDV